MTKHVLIAFLAAAYFGFRLMTDPVWILSILGAAVVFFAVCWIFKRFDNAAPTEDQAD